MRLLYLIGPPGVGKTTALREALGEPDRVITEPFGHTVHYDSNIIELGVPRHPFGGTDTLGFHVQPIVLRWLRAGIDAPYLVVGEGDRLGNPSFFDACPVPFSMIALDGPHLSRRLARGEGQDVTWLKGRITKYEGLVEVYRPEIMDVSGSIEEVGAMLRERLMTEVGAIV